MAKAITTEEYKVKSYLHVQHILESERREAARGKLKTFHHGRATAFEDTSEVFRHYTYEWVYDAVDVAKLRDRLELGLFKTINILFDELPEGGDIVQSLLDLYTGFTGRPLEPGDIDLENLDKLAALIAHKVLPDPGDAIAVHDQTLSAE